MKKGISLITLIITIVVVIILAAVVILALGNNNPIDSARLSTVVNSKTNMEDCISIVASKKIAETEGKEQMSDIVKSIIDESTSEVKFTQGGTEKTIYRIAPDEFKSRLGIVVKETPNKDCIWYVDNAGKVYLVFDFMKNVPNYLKESDTTLNKSVKNFVIVLDSALESSIIENIEISKTEDTVGVGEDKNITLDLSKVEGLSYSKWVINESKEKLGVDDEAKYPNTVEGNSAAISLKSITNPGTYYLHVLVCTNDMKVEKISSAIVVEKKADVWDGSIAEEFASGDGTEANPYIIETAAQLAYFRKRVNEDKDKFAYKYISLINDIDLNNIEWAPIGINNSSEFAGTFDGKGSKIYNLRISEEVYADQVGLFSKTFSSSIIKNIGVESGTIEPKDGVTFYYTGAIVGYSEGKLYNCYNKINIVGTNCTGGIVGYAHFDNTIENCFNLGNIKSTADNNVNVGGIVGCAGWDCIIKNCYNKGNCEGVDQIGGIIGTSGGTIENCYNTGNIKSGDDVGGIAAIGNSTEIKNCYNLGNLEGYSIGGITSVSNYIISNCYNSGRFSLLNRGTSAGIVRSSGNISKLENNYYLTGTDTLGVKYNGSFEVTKDKVGSYEATDTMPSVISVVNGDNAFKEDTKNVNNGYPILSWQTK